MTYGVALMADKTKRAKAKTPKESPDAKPRDTEKRPARPPAVDPEEAQAARNRARERSGSED
jgi:hypothetical protein